MKMWYNTDTTRAEYQGALLFSAAFPQTIICGQSAPFYRTRVLAARVVTAASRNGRFAMKRQRSENGRYSCEYNLSDKDLKILYVERGLSVNKVSQLLGIGTWPIYRRLGELGWIRKFGETRRMNGSAKGDKNPNWNGGRYRRSGGYIMVCVDGAYVAEHRYIAEKKLGRKLRADEVVHHKDGDKANNSPENLVIYSSHAEHMRAHMTSDEAKRRGAKKHEKQ